MDCGRQSQASLRIHEERLSADPSRVVLRPFHLGWHTEAGIKRAARLVHDVCALSEREAEQEYELVLRDFSERHWQTEKVFHDRYREVRSTLWIDDAKLSPLRKRLIGSYFCHEYTYAAAALMNPSIVPHPDQSGMHGGAVRLIIGFNFRLEF